MRPTFLRPILMSLALAGVFALPSTADAGLAEAGEVEAARANARAGGPLSDRDKELLDRYGCLSGTRNAFCAERERYHSWTRPKKRAERRYRRR